MVALDAAWQPPRVGVLATVRIFAVITTGR